jgi:hypothetical protein
MVTIVLIYISNLQVPNVESKIYLIIIALLTLVPPFYFCIKSTKS